MKTGVITFLGDVMLGRLITNKEAVDENIIKILHNSSLTVANLECVVTEGTPSRSQLVSHSKTYMCKHGADHEQASLLKTLNVTACNLANNHVLDYGFDGVKSTIQFLNENDIKWFGFGRNWDVAWKPRKMKFSVPTTEGLEIVKVALFGLADHFVEWKADDGGAGINFFDIGNFLNEQKNLNRAQWDEFEFIEEHIKKVRKSVDLVIFSIHWGENFQKKVSKTFQAFAHTLIDHGVDIIHGHSSHHFQGVEVYKGKLILYGCGDFINDYDLYEDLLQNVGESFGEDYVKFRCDLGFVYQLHIERSDSNMNNTISFSRLTMTPITITNGNVQLSSGKDRHGSFNRMIKACKQFGTDISIDDENDVLIIEIT